VSPRSDAAPGPVLVLTPTGRDGSMVCATLEAAGLGCEQCADLEELLGNLTSAATALIAQEALSVRGSEALLAALDAQEPWSDVPILLLTLPLDQRASRVHGAAALLERANVTLLQRPLPAPLLVSAARSAVRARRRQYQVRALNKDLERAVHLGDMFVSILGHDLRTPLSAIRMSAETIVRQSHEAPALRPAGRILTSADRMGRMIAQLLDFARIRQGRGIGLKLERSNVIELVRQVSQELEDAAPDARLELLPSGDLWGMWDPDRLAQVVSNLAENAVRHGAAGKPITVEVDGTHPTLVRLRFRNFGAIPSAALAGLFEPFKRTEPTRTGQRGLGLGLFIAREIARAHGGDIGVQTSDDTTVFEVSLPREAHPADTVLTAT